MMFLKNNSHKTFRFLPHTLIVVNILFSFSILFPTPKQTTQQFISDWRHGFFQDMYEMTSATTQQLTTRRKFYRFGQQILYDAQIEDVDITIKPYSWQHFRSPQYIPLRITYKTRNLGSFEEHQTIPLILENGQWRASWTWDYLIRDLTTASTVEASIEPAKRGALLAKNGVLLSSDQPSVLVWLDPKGLSKDTEDEVFTALETLFDKSIKAVHFHERYVRLGAIGKPIPMGVLMHPSDPQIEMIFKQFPILMTTKTYGRFIIYNSAYDIGTVTNSLFSECCSLLYSTTSYDGRDGLEKTYNQVLKGQNGGTMVLKNQEGRIVRTLIAKTRRDGDNVRLTY